MPRRISGVATFPDQIGQAAERDPTEVGQDVKHITTALRKANVLDQLADRGMHREYAECPPGADPHHQHSEGRCEEDGHVDHLVEPGDPRPSQPVWGIDGDQLHTQRYAESQAPPELLGAPFLGAQSLGAWLWFADNSAGRWTRLRRREPPGHTAGVVMFARAAASTAAATTLATS